METNLSFMKKYLAFLFLVTLFFPGTFVVAAVKPIINVSAKVTDSAQGPMLRVTALAMDENGDAVDTTNIYVDGQNQKCSKYYYCQLTFGPFNFTKAKNIKYSATATVGKIVAKSAVKNFLIKPTSKKAAPVVSKDNDVVIKARDARRLSNLKQIQTALELYFTDNNSYPDGQKIVLGTKNYFCLNKQGWQPKGCLHPYMLQIADESLGGQFFYSKVGKGYEVQTKLEGTINNLHGTVLATPEGLKDATGNLFKVEPVKKSSDDLVTDFEAGQNSKPPVEQTRDKERYSALKQIQTALYIFYNEQNSSYPIAKDAVLGDATHACLDKNGWQTATPCSISSTQNHPFMGKVPADPGNKTYVYNSDGKSYTITAELEMGGFNNFKAGKILVTPDEIKNVK